MNFRSMYNPDGLRVPSSAAGMRRRLKASSGFEAPPTLILDGYCTPVENQGATPQCAAYAASSFAESVRWRTTGRKEQIDPAALYARAKELDGDNGPGTTIDHALQALIDAKVFKKSCMIRLFGNSFFGFGQDLGLTEVKYAVHRYGCCVAGFSITTEWYDPKNAVVQGGPDFTCEGGHAVLVCGYDPTGVLVMNSWGPSYGRDGKVFISNRAFAKQFMYGAVLTKSLDGLE